ncbi:hypothetical protein [Athalassotoga saccharophila]|uniref:hypothetical protein n=1 Tax=Athalassotoga saccharophila TaxID=1441386 RepID=UPI001379D962|nr:hypothetical protein [Athalassotoga saccharophila]BBJ27536.1 hypothetical protein ATHSA_0412 [Athalassotoga saccharophila]
MRKILLFLLITGAFAGLIFADYISQNDFANAQNYIFEQLTLKATDGSVVLGVAAKPITLTFLGEMLTYNSDNTLQHFADVLFKLNYNPDMYVIVGLKGQETPVIVVKSGVRKYVSLTSQMIGKYNDYNLWLCVIPISESNYYITAKQAFSDDSFLYFMPMDDKLGTPLCPKLGPVTYQQIIQNQQ